MGVGVPTALRQETESLEVGEVVLQGEGSKSEKERASKAVVFRTALALPDGHAETPTHTPHLECPLQLGPDVHCELLRDNEAK